MCGRLCCVEKVDLWRAKFKNWTTLLEFRRPARFLWADKRKIAASALGVIRRLCDTVMCLPVSSWCQLETDRSASLLAVCDLTTFHLYNALCHSFLHIPDGHSFDRYECFSGSTWPTNFRMLVKAILQHNHGADSNHRPLHEPRHLA